jgi:hypothetical protein
MFLMLLSTFTIFFISNTVKGDTVYFEGFSGYEDGTDYLNSYNYGEKWLNVSFESGSAGSGGIYTVGDYSRFYFSRNNGLHYETNWTFFNNFYMFDIPLLLNGGVSARWYLTWTFYDSNHEQLFKIHWADNSDTGTNRDVVLYDDNNVNIGSDSASDPLSPHIIIYYNISEQEININITGTTIDVWFDVDDFDYIDYIYIEHDQQEATYNLACEGIYAWTTSSDYLWELDELSFGDVIEEGSGTFVQTYDTSPNYVNEIRRDGLNANITIKQVALQTLSISNLDDTDIFVKIGNELTGTYNTSYDYGASYQILVWQNLDINTEYRNDHLVEFKTNFGASGQTLYLTFSNYDIDGDGDTQRKLSTDVDYFDGVYNGETTASSDFVYEVWYELESGGEQEEGDFFVNFYDIESGNQLTLFGSNTNGYGTNYIEASFESDLWGGEYYDRMYDRPHAVNVEFTNGDSHSLYIEGFQGNEFTGLVDGVAKTFKRFTYTQDLYHGQTYNLFVIPVGYTGDPGYPYCSDNVITWWNILWECRIGMYRTCFTKNTYDYGETVYMEYMLPHISSFIGCGAPASGWELRLIDSDGDVRHKWFYDDGDFEMNGIYNKMSWVANDTLGIGSTYGGYHTRWEKYTVELWIDSWQFWMYSGPVGLHRCSGDSFTPTGSIISISPNPAYIGQKIEFVINCNSDGFLEYNFYGHKEYSYFKYFNGNRQIYHSPSAYVGDWSVVLYGYGADGEVVCDDDTFTLLGSDDDYGSYGFGEYLMIYEKKYVAAANETINIIYRTLSDESNLSIYTPSGEKSVYSTVVNDSGIYEIHLSPNVEIGVWRVIMDNTTGCYPEWLAPDDCNHWLNTSFDVISEEYNWVEFGQNVFYTDEIFTVLLKHTHDIALVFYKYDNVKSQWVKQGTTWRMDMDEHPEELIEPLQIPPNMAKPSVGDWKVELWRTNWYNIVKLLAVDECIVEVAPIDDIEVGQTDVLPKLDIVLGAIVGLIVTMFCLLSPLLIAKGLRVKSGIPPEAYSMSGGVGIVVCVLLGWFPIWVLVFILIIAIIMIAIKWIQAHKSTGD